MRKFKITECADGEMSQYNKNGKYKTILNSDRNKLKSDSPVPKSHLHLSQELALHSTPF
jgi:hypothetical protein